MDDDTFEALMTVHEQADDPLPDPQPLGDVVMAPNPADPNNFETLVVDEGVVETAARALEAEPASGNGSSGDMTLGELDGRIAYLQ